MVFRTRQLFTLALRLLGGAMFLLGLLFTFTFVLGSVMMPFMDKIGSFYLRGYGASICLAFAAISSLGITGGLRSLRTGSWAAANQYSKAQHYSVAFILLSAGILATLFSWKAYGRLTFAPLIALMGPAMVYGDFRKQQKQMKMPSNQSLKEDAP